MSEAQENNKALVRRFLEEVAKGNLDVIDESLSPDFVDRSLVPGQGPTREDFKRLNREVLDAFSTISFTIEEQIAEGDTVVTKYRLSGVSRGEYMGFPPSGEQERSRASTSTAYPGTRSRRSGARLMFVPSGRISRRRGSLEEALLEELYSFVGEGWEQQDDITFLTLERSATRS